MINIGVDGSSFANLLGAVVNGVFATVGGALSLVANLATHFSARIGG